MYLRKDGLGRTEIVGDGELEPTNNIGSIFPDVAERRNASLQLAKEANDFRTLLVRLNQKDYWLGPTGRKYEITKRGQKTLVSPARYNESIKALNEADDAAQYVLHMLRDEPNSATSVLPVFALSPKGRTGRYLNEVRRQRKLVEQEADQLIKQEARSRIERLEQVINPYHSYNMPRTKQALEEIRSEIQTLRNFVGPRPTQGYNQENLLPYGRT
jgi:hypothetical protein